LATLEATLAEITGADAAKLELAGDAPAAVGGAVGIVTLVPAGAFVVGGLAGRPVPVTLAVVAAVAGDAIGTVICAALIFDAGGALGFGALDGAGDSVWLAAGALGAVPVVPVGAAAGWVGDGVGVVAAEGPITVATIMGPALTVGAMVAAGVAATCGVAVFTTSAAPAMAVGVCDGG
jgi:hypothetical protein